jgi:hypothetical protein
VHLTRRSVIVGAEEVSQRIFGKILGAPEELLSSIPTLAYFKEDERLKMRGDMVFDLVTMLSWKVPLDLSDSAFREEVGHARDMMQGIVEIEADVLGSDMLAACQVMRKSFADMDPLKLANANALGSKLSPSALNPSPTEYNTSARNPHAENRLSLGFGWFSKCLTPFCKNHF